MLNYLDEEMVPYLTQMGFSCVIHKNPRADAGPILVAQRFEDDALPTVRSGLRARICCCRQLRAEPHGGGRHVRAQLPPPPIHWRR